MTLLRITGFLRGAWRVCAGMGVRRGAPGVAGLACVALAVLCSPAAFAQRPEGFIPGTIHTIFSTECNKYFDWRVGGCCRILLSLSPSRLVLLAGSRWGWCTARATWDRRGPSRASWPATSAFTSTAFSHALFLH